MGTFAQEVVGPYTVTLASIVALVILFGKRALSFTYRGATANIAEAQRKITSDITELKAHAEIAATRADQAASTAAEISTAVNNIGPGKATLTQRVDALTDQATTLTTTVTDLHDTVSTIHDRVGKLESSMDNVLTDTRHMRRDLGTIAVAVGKMQQIAEDDTHHPNGTRSASKKTAAATTVARSTAKKATSTQR